MTSPRVPATEPVELDPLDPVDLVAVAVTGVPGVTGMHAGSFGEVATYLPGRRVTGVRRRDGRTEVHVTVAMGVPIAQLAAQVRLVVSAITGDEVHVVVEDVTPDTPPFSNDLRSPLS